MRVAQKQQIEKFIDLLPEMSEAIKILVQTNPQEAEKLMIECSQGIHMIKKLLQESEKVDCKTFQLLAQYEQTMPAGEISLWEELRLSVGDIKVKKEMVFLPYNASMWDSLESIWKVASEDEDCDVYVVPIPYFDKQPNGDFGEMHYEGDKLPAYVPITRYEDYDISVRRPDVIFIHNPYDEFNRVTSVHPDYYAKVLKEYTDKLVYIPYFVLNDIEPNDSVKIELMKQFCYLPGTIYADTVILQSEKMRNIYINEYIKVAKKLGENICREDLEKRFLGLGSPKFDKLTSIEFDADRIPIAWQKLIMKQDGSKKKIVLYNTSVTTFLQVKEKELAKIQEVLNLFYENREEVTLLWRPHPLMKKTIATLHPELLEEYEVIVRAYCEAGWGIYDDTPDLDRAIALSDLYYGDYSSLMALFRNAGKPVMIQSAESIEEISARKMVRFPDFVFYKDKMYFAAWNGNGIFSYHPETETLKFEKLLPYSVSEKQQFGHSLLVGNKWYLSPIRRDCILEVDMDTWECKEFYLDKSACGSLSGCQDIFADGDDLYFLPYFSKAICKLNTQTQEVTYFGEGYEIIPEEKKKLDTLIWGSGIKNGDEIYLPVRGTNALVCFNVKSHKTELLEVGEENLNFLGMTYDGENYWIFTINGLVYKWNKISGVKAIIETNQNAERSNICYANGYIWLVATNRGTYCKIDAKTAQIVVNKSYIPEGAETKLGIDNIQLVENCLYVCPTRGDLFVRIDLCTEDVVTKTLQLSKEEYDAYKRAFTESVSENLYEQNNVDSRLMIEYVLSDKKSKTHTEMRLDVGRTIFHEIK